MAKLVCQRCQNVFDVSDGDTCPRCNMKHPYVYRFQNSDDYLNREVPRVMDERKRTGLESLVGGLECVIINTEPARQRKTVDEFLRTTGLDVDEAFEDSRYRTVVLKTEESADLLIRARKEEPNPFSRYNTFPKSNHLPNTRLETFVFRVYDIGKYVGIQKSRGVQFMTADVLETDHYRSIQTHPMKSTGTSIGVIQWKTEQGRYGTREARSLDWKFEKPGAAHLSDIKELDHTALRVKAKDRDTTIIEFMELTNYTFDFAIYVKMFNSITNVARLSDETFAMVFTSGISAYLDDETSGPTEKFIHNYGTRVHHLAFHTEQIEATYSALQDDGMKFLVELVGSPQEGLKQTFSVPSDNTLLVNEYIHRYGDFDGFFTKSNVTRLTEATEKQ